MYIYLVSFGRLLLCVCVYMYVVNGGTFKCPAAHIVKISKPLCVVVGTGDICSIAARQEVLLRVPPFISLFPLAHQVPKRIYERISIPLEGIR